MRDIIQHDISLLTHLNSVKVSIKIYNFYQNYLSKFLPELSEGANKYAIRHPRLQVTSMSILKEHVDQLASDKSLGQLKIVTTNVQIMTLFGLKRIVKSCLVQTYSYYCAITNCCLSNLCQLSSLINVMLIVYYNVNFRINILYLFSICYIFFNEIVSHYCLVPIYYLDFYILMYLYSHCTIVCECECVVTLFISSFLHQHTSPFLYFQ